MKKTYRINPFAFILFLFGLTLITVAPVKAQTQIEKLIERIEKLEAFHSDVGSESKSDSGNIEAPPAGPWDPSMGMRHPARPCMDRTKVPGGCGPDRRSPEQIASDPYDRNNPVSLAARGEAGADSPPHDPNGPWDPSMGMRHPARPCMDRTKVPGGCGPDRRSPEQIASDPYDRNNPRSLAGTADHNEMRSPHLREIDATPQGRGKYCYKERNFIRECNYRGGKYMNAGLSGGMGRCTRRNGPQPLITACQDAQGFVKNSYK